MANTGPLQQLKRELAGTESEGHSHVTSIKPSDSSHFIRCNPLTALHQSLMLLSVGLVSNAVPLFVYCLFSVLRT